MSDKRRRRRQNSEGSEHSESDETESKDGVEEVDIDKDEGVVSFLHKPQLRNKNVLRAAALGTTWAIYSVDIH